MANRFDGDWDKWRRTFISGGDDVTLKWLSEQPGAPSYSSIRKRSSPKREDWEEQRRHYRNNLGTITADVPEVKEVAQKVEKIIDSAEMMTRHLKAAKLIGGKALQAFSLMAPDTIKPSEAVAMMKLAVEVERLTEGLATERQQIDLTAMSDADLEKLANG